MSASQEKKKRREERSEGVEKKQIRKNSTARAKKRSRIIGSVVAIVLVLLVLFLVVMNSSLFYSSVSALTVGSRSYTADEYNYFYQNQLYTEYNRLYQNFGDYTSYFLDLNKPLTEQNYPGEENKTWADYLEEQTLAAMQETTVLSEAADANGYVLTDEDKALIESTVDNAKTTASNAGTSFKSYLSSAYGRGFTEEMYRKVVADQVKAVSYRNLLLEDWESGYSDAQLSAKYDEISDRYDLFTYCLYYVNGAADDEAGIDADTAMNNAYTVAQSIAAGKTEEVFLELVQQTVPEEEQENYAELSSVLRKNVSASSLSTNVYYDWLISADRAYGDTTVVESNSGYYAVLFVGRNHNDYTLKSFRHILVQVDEGEDVDSGSAALAAQTEANSLYEQWKEDPTEENFITLANANSDDSGSNTNGGLYENVAMGQMVAPIEDWLFEEGRQPGDTTLVYASSSNYKGYHIVYYVGESDRPYNLQIASNEQQNDDYTAWLEANRPNYEIKKGFAFRFTTK